MRPLELCSRFEAGRRRPGAARARGEQEQSNQVKAIVPPSLLLDINLSFKLVVDIRELISVVQSFRESNFSGEPPSFVTKVAVFYWQPCNLSGGEYLPQKADDDSFLM